MCIRDRYQQQMNEIIQPFIVKTGAINNFFIEEDEHRYEAFFQQDLAQENSVAAMGEEERKFETKFDIKVLGYLIGAAGNDKYPKLSVRENAVEFRFQRERVVFGDEIEHTDRNDKYRAGADTLKAIGGRLIDK